MNNIIPLHECPRNCRIRYCGNGVSAGGEYDFSHLDGMYGTAYEDDGRIIYFSPTSMVQVIDDYMYKLWE
jgi:hypothetical protein